MISLVADRASSPLPDGDCGCWSGTIAGNDAGAQGLLRLCRRGARVSGTLRWASRRSGQSVRALSGTIDGSELRLHDDRMLVNEPLPMWRFCLVEEYRLSLDSETARLSGGYRSPDCRDQAQVRLTPAARVRCMLSILQH